MTSLAFYCSVEYKTFDILQDDDVRAVLWDSLFVDQVVAISVVR